jgi:YD repeat-containing protein
VNEEHEEQFPVWETKMNARRSGLQGACILVARLYGLPIAFLLALLSPAPASSTDLWTTTFGVPCCTIPPEKFKYLDADEACRAEQPLPGDIACSVNARNMRNFGGPQQQNVCVWDTTCTCSTCGILPDFPNGGNTQLNHGNFTWKEPHTCPAGIFPQLDRCDPYPPKTKGCGSSDGGGSGGGGPGDGPGPLLANPCNVITGNKLQEETIYRSPSGRVSLVLTYNSQDGSTYFQAGPFGAHWSSRPFARLRDSAQGIIAVERPNGRELEFRAPPSGNVYAADADISDKLERITDASGNFQEWRLTTSTGDEQFAYDAAGHLLAIRDRALVAETMTYSTASTPLTVAPEAGLLIASSDPYGRQLTYTYDVMRRVVTMTDPAGGLYRFNYDSSTGPMGTGNLTKVTFPDGHTRTYFYGEAAQINGGTACSSPASNLPHALTGIQDENGVRFATWTYDCQGRATSSEHASGADRYTFTFNPDNRVVVDPLGTSRTFNLTSQSILGVAYNTGTTQPAASGSGSVSNAFSRDGNGNLASRTDYNGNLTNYSYDLTRNLETSRTEAFGTPQARTISTEWHPTFRLPARTAEPLRITTYVYNSDGGANCGFQADGVTLVPGVLCSKTIQPTTDATGATGFGATATGTPRTWTYTYDANGSVLTMNGPRTDVSDVSTTTYYSNNDADLGKRGNVATITNALGHVTQITAYNAHGQPLTIVDPNGLTTNLAYDSRQRLTSRNVGGELTNYDYDNVGQLTKVTLPDGSFLSYSYDAAHRLTGMSDSLGNRTAYTLDAMGNRTQEQVFDPVNALAQTRSRVFNNLNRLFQEIGATGQTTQYAYDNQGNLTSVDGPLQGAVDVTVNAYDALNRLRQVTDPNNGITQYAYNGIDQLVSVTDPRNLATTYNYDGLANLNSQQSPDTGTTSNTYDAAGNLLTQTDAKGQVTTYTYDDLNRVALIASADGSLQTHGYDAGANGIGRLTSITEFDPSHEITSALTYTYDQHGRTISETRTINGVAYVLSYSYDAFGRLSGMTYPSGRTIAYGFDSLGRISQVSTTPFGGAEQLVAGNIAYQPFGGVKSYTLGNGQTYTRGFDLDGRIASYSQGAQTYAIGYDAASRVSFITDTANAANSNTYSYDNLDRLIGAVLPNLPYAYGYDAVGNRTSKTVGSATDTYAYSPTSNQIASIAAQSGAQRNFAFDANGSTTADGNNLYGYDTRGRMVQSTSALGATTYQVNALGQRIRKTNSSDDRVFLYDTRGRLIAETDPGGTLKREYLYLNDIPLAVIQ